MRNVTLFLITVVLFLTGCEKFDSIQVKGSGQMVSFTPSVDEFDRLEIGSTFKVTVRQGDSHSVQVSVDDNMRDYVVARTNGSTLELHLDGSAGFSEVNVSAEITVPDLRKIEVGGASSTHVVQFTTDRTLKLEASGASSIEGKFDAMDVEIDVSGASGISLTGTCRELDLEGSAASKASLSAFQCRDTTVDLSGSSDASIFVNGRLKADLSGASSLVYSGKVERQSIETSGASSAKPAR